jgi:hypothetical protein
VSDNHAFKLHTDTFEMYARGHCVSLHCVNSRVI